MEEQQTTTVRFLRFREIRRKTRFKLFRDVVVVEMTIWDMRHFKWTLSYIGAVRLLGMRQVWSLRKSGVCCFVLLNQLWGNLGPVATQNAPEALNRIHAFILLLSF